MMEYGTRDAVFMDMKHPYTIGLMESIPKMGVTVENLKTIEGMVPSIFQMPVGCKFSPRCTCAKAMCSQSRPPLYDTGNGHMVRCFQYSPDWNKEEV